MNIAQRLRAAWRGLTGQRSDPYAGLYGSGGGGGFAGGAVNRLTASLASWSGAINADLDASLPVLRARARDLAANNEHGRRFLSLVAGNVVGRRNPRLQVRATMANPDKKGRPLLDKSANDAIEIHWERWGQNADISGRHRSLYSMLRTTAKGVARDGEALVRLVRNRRLPYGLGLQLLEADRLDETFNARLDNGNVIRQGVEVDSALRAVAYHIKTSHPGENAVMSRPGTERVAAADMFHLFLPERAEQVRGVTWLHAVIMRGSIIHKFEEAAVIAAQIGASKIAALERADDGPDATLTMADGTSAGIPQMKVEAGEMFELPPGYKLNSWNPEYPHANFESFLKACLRGLAAGLDVAAHNLTGDMTDVNYSSARIAELSEREAWMVLQDWLIESFLQPLYEEWLGLALLAGAITFETSGKALPADKYDKFARASRFQGRRWAWVDPAKEAEANEKLLANLLTSRTRIAAEQGEEFDDILDERAAEEQAIADAGIGEPEAPDAADPEKAPEVLAAKERAAGQVRAAELALDAARARRPADTHVHLPPPPEIRNEINVAPAAAPVVNVAAADVPVVNVAAPSVECRVEALMPEQPAPTIEVKVELPAEQKMKITALPARETKTRIGRNGAGEIVTSSQIETDV